MLLILLAAALLTEPVPADGLRLAPDPSPPTTTAAVVVPAAPPGSPRVPLGTALAGLAAGITALAVGAARRPRPQAQPTGEPLVVFVPGHGSHPAPVVFNHLVRLMGIDRSQARYFDYRWADGGAGHLQASRNATIDETADALAGYLAGLGESGRPVYLVGFSKGGAGIAELVSRWDRGEPAAAGVRGAVLLDPPIAGGLHGLLQSLGTLWGPLPDDGGYQPVHCRLTGCEDYRAHLGEASGIAVLVVRNPASRVANFSDIPPGLRVYDVNDGGPGLSSLLFTRPWALPGRISEAHNAVLHDPAVAACIVAEMRRPGSCTLPPAAQSPARAVAGPNGPVAGGMLNRVPTVV